MRQVMQRFRLVLAAVAVMATMLVAAAAPAMAHGRFNGNDARLDRIDIGLERQLLNAEQPFFFERPFVLEALPGSRRNSD
ncbi:MAG: hypothetical protein LC740_02140 [Actinobacteria bacterium]|nr:hypothetical protein [Actinomycetota bacterium]